MQTQSIAQNLQYQRKLKGLSQEQLAEKTAVTTRTIQRIEKGEVKPYLNTVKLLATALEIEVEDLIPIENPKEESIQKKWLLLLHGTPILGLMIPLCNILIPLFIWIHKREDNTLYYEHGRKVINFQITFTILYALAFVSLLTIEGYGFLFFISVLPYGIIIMLINIIRVVNEKSCFYPLSVPFIGGQNLSKALVLLWIASLLSFAVKAQQNDSIERLDGSSISTQALTRQIKELAKAAKVTGLTVSIFQDNQVAYQEAFGYANKPKGEVLRMDHVYYGASFSKAVFGYLVAQLAAESIIDLDKPLQNYLDVPIPEMPLEKDWREFTNLKGDDRYKEITARMCLTHTTGLPNWRWIDENGDLDRDGKIKFYFDPGTQYSYSGEGMMLLQYVIEHITGKGLEQLARERIFGPLDMEQTSYLWQDRFEGKYCLGHTADEKTIPKDPTDEAGAAGSMETTPADYAKFVAHILQQEEKNKKVIDTLFTRNFAIRTAHQFGPDSKKITGANADIQLNYGLGWGLLETPYSFGAFKEGHDSGFQHYSIIFPERDMGIVIMTNSDNGESIFKALLEITIGDTYTPWQWQRYVPFNLK